MSVLSPTAAAADAAGVVPGLRALVDFLAVTHGITADPAVLDDTERRLRRQPPSGVIDALRHLAADAGLSVARVTRPLGEVLRDASAGMPWIALRLRDGRAEALAVLGATAGGARVIVPGADTRPGRWSLAALRDWLQVPDSGTPAEWLIAEPAAPLSALRSAAAGRATPAARLRALLGTERGTLWIAVVYSAVIGLLSLVVPIAVQLLVNTIAFGSLLQPLAVLMVAVLLALGCNTALNALRAGVVEIVQRSIFARVATDVTWRLLRVRVDAFDRYHGPELVNRFFDTVTVQKAAALLLIDGLSVAMQTAIGLVLLALYHPILLAFDVLLVAAMALIVGPMGRGAVGTAIKESKAKYALEAWLEQIAAHLVTFKSAGAAPFATARAHRLLDDYLHYRRAHFRILVRQIVGAFGLQAIASATLLGIGGWLVVNRQLTLGQLVASELVVTLMMSAFTKFGKQLEVYYDLCAALDKLGDLVDLPLERRGGESLLPRTGPAGLTLRDVEVRYSDATRPALQVSALTLRPGEHVGLVGANGSGKSTLADVVFGLRTPSTGAVLIDGVDQRLVPLDALREAVALVRGIELFPGSIVDNVRLGRTDLSLDDVTRVLDAVGLLDELRHLPDGLDTELHPHGRPLSHRQAGRLMIARALAGRPRLLVLDGALDLIDQPEEQARLDAVLFAADAPWTTLCITDRPDVLARCARVVRLRDGAIEETTR
ncbi:MAG: ATP-binding cassette domain-containing protein [Vicinamibacterales bacterium]